MMSGNGNRCYAKQGQRGLLIHLSMQSATINETKQLFLVALLS